MQRDFASSLEQWNLAGCEPITLTIDSTGGNLFAARFIADAIRFSEAPVHGVVVGAAFSGAFQVLQACHRRLAYPSARFMFHYGRFEIDLDENARPEEVLREGVAILNEYLNALAVLSGKNLKTIKAWARAARKFGSEEALRCGFLDEILTPPAR